MASKTVGSGDVNQSRVLCHDLKSLLKRFACSQSFSRDSQGGGPEHNMQFVPYLVSLLTLSLQHGSNRSPNLLQDGASSADAPSSNLAYVQEKKLADFLELSTKQRQVFLERLALEAAEDSKLEDSKQAHSEEEEEKHLSSDEEDKQMDDEEGEEESLSDDFGYLRPAAALGGSA